MRALPRPLCRSRKTHAARTGRGPLPITRNRDWPAMVPMPSGLVKTPRTPVKAQHQTGDFQCRYPARNDTPFEGAACASSASSAGLVKNRSSVARLICFVVLSGQVRSPPHPPAHHRSILGSDGAGCACPRKLTSRDRIWRARARASTLSRPDSAPFGRQHNARPAHQPPHPAPRANCAPIRQCLPPSGQPCAAICKRLGRVLYQPPRPRSAANQGARARTQAGPPLCVWHPALPSHRGLLPDNCTPRSSSCHLQDATGTHDHI